MLMRIKSSLKRALGPAQTLTVIQAMVKPREGIGYENRCGGGAE